jgi:hypothetical protein
VGKNKMGKYSIFICADGRFALKISKNIVDVSFFSISNSKKE